MLVSQCQIFVPVAWLAWLPVGWLGWLCLGFLWLISEDDVIFRVDASFVNPVGVRFVWIVHCWGLSWWWALFIYGEFDPGSGRTLAACLTHASRTMMPSLLGGLVANG